MLHNQKRVRSTLPIVPHTAATVWKQIAGTANLSTNRCPPRTSDRRNVRHQRVMGIRLFIRATRPLDRPTLQAREQARPLRHMNELRAFDTPSRESKRR